MTPEEMQERIEYLLEQWHTVCLMASESNMTPVPPSGTIERDEEIESLIDEFDTDKDDDDEPRYEGWIAEEKEEELENAEIPPDRDLRDDTGEE